MIFAPFHPGNKSWKMEAGGSSFSQATVDAGFQPAFPAREAFRGTVVAVTWRGCDARANLFAPDKSNPMAAAKFPAA
jgi:hypothetical protein